MSLHFETLYREQYPFVWRTLRRLGIAAADIDDACQKVFLVAYRRLPEFEGRSSLRTWLCGIALRVTSEDRRRSVTRREVPLVEQPMQEAAGDGVLESLEQRERLRELDAILTQLPAEQRTVLVLFELEGMSGQEIATAVGIPLGTVRSRLRLARQTFSNVVLARRGIDGRTAAGGAI